MLLWNVVIHYLDDFLAVFPPHTDPTPYSDQFNRLCKELGISVNHEKDAAGTIAEFMAFELDTIKMQARLPDEKLQKGIRLLDSALAKGSIARPELESLIGFLSFAAKVILPGRAFLRRLYDLLAGFSYYTHITPGVKQDLLWWREFLSNWNGIKILRHPDQPVKYMWTDASGNLGLGGYILDHISQAPSLHNGFSKRTPSRHVDKDIQFKEMLAVLTGIRAWLSSLEGYHIHVHVDNTAVFWGLIKTSIRGQAMSPLRAIVMLMARYDITIAVHWIPTDQNCLADWLSRFQFDKIANMYPQLSPLGLQGPR